MQTLVIKLLDVDYKAVGGSQEPTWAGGRALGDVGCGRTMLHRRECHHEGRQCQRWYYYCDTTNEEFRFDLEL